MHIAVISHIFYPDKGDPFGGFEMARHLADRGHKISVITWNMNNRQSTEIIAPNLTIYRLAGYNLSRIIGSTEYPFLFSIHRLIAELRPDIVHAQSHLFLTTLQAIVSCKLNKVPIVVAVHGVFAKRSTLLDMKQKIYLHFFGRIIFAAANKVMCLTRSDACEIQHFGCDPAKIVIIPNAVDTIMFRPGAKDHNSIIWVGRFVNEKGVQDLIKAARIVCDRNSDAQFLLVGDGPVKMRMEFKVKELRLEKNVIFKGRMSRNEISQLLASAPIFVLPSYKEGLPLTLLEAMSSGSAVVAYDIAGINEIIQNSVNGILVKKYDTIELADAISELLSNREKSSNLGEGARKTIQQEYEWQILLPNLEALYKGIC